MTVLKVQIPLKGDSVLKERLMRDFCPNNLHSKKEKLLHTGAAVFFSFWGLAKKKERKEHFRITKLWQI
jgi:hypothetical protein